MKTTVVQKSWHNMILPGEQTQTDNFSSETLRKVESIFTSLHSGALCQIMDIFLSGYGNLNTDTELFFIRFVYEEKIKFWKKFNFFQTLVVLDHHHMKCKPYQTFISIFNNGPKTEIRWAIQIQNNPHSFESRLWMGWFSRTWHSWTSPWEETSHRYTSL